MVTWFRKLTHSTRYLSAVVWVLRMECRFFCLRLLRVVFTRTLFCPPTRLAELRMSEIVLKGGKKKQSKAFDWKHARLEHLCTLGTFPVHSHFLDAGLNVFFFFSCHWLYWFPDDVLQLYHVQHELTLTVDKLNTKHSDEIRNLQKKQENQMEGRQIKVKLIFLVQTF